MAPLASDARESLVNVRRGRCRRGWRVRAHSAHRPAHPGRSGKAPRSAPRAPRVADRCRRRRRRSCRWAGPAAARRPGHRRETKLSSSSRSGEHGVCGAQAGERGCAPMHVGAAALAFPAGAALVLLAVRGPVVLEGEAALPFALLAVTGAVGIIAWAMAYRRARRGGIEVPAAVEAFLGGVATPLGDAAVAFDAEGRLVWANDAAVALSGYAVDALLGRGRDVLGDDLAVLARGPATGRVGIRTPAGRVPARAATVRIPGALPLDIAALRVEPPEPPPPAAPEPPLVDDADIVPEPPALRVGPAPPQAVPIHAALAALASELSGPLSRASAAASLLRLTLPSVNDEHLGRIERELGAAEATLSVLLEPLPPPLPRAVDVDLILSEALGQAVFAAGVHVRRIGGAAAALADAGQLGQALHHLLRLASAAMPAGGELGLRTARRGREVLLEISDTGAGAPPCLDLALAERLVAAQGGRLERQAVSGRGEVSRVTLPAVARDGR